MLVPASESVASISSSVDMATWVTAGATIALTLVTAIYVRLTRGILENQSNPYVIVTVFHDDENPTILQLVIKNVGAGLAQDITFRLSRPIPARAWGIVETDAPIAEIMTRGPLVEGVPALGPGEQRRIFWGQYGGLAKNLGSDPVAVTCNFKKNGKPMPPVVCRLDVRSFEGTAAAERPTVKAARELAEISKVLHDLARGHSKLRVEIVKDDDLTLTSMKDSGLD